MLRGTLRQRILVPPPEGMHVEWQVWLETTDDMAVKWCTYAPDLQEVIERDWARGAPHINFMLCESSQTYRLDLNKMELTCTSAVGVIRKVRRIFVPDTPSPEV